MKNIAICSLFKDSVRWHSIETDQVNRFFNTIEEQKQNLNKNFNLSINVLENDSQDETERHIRINQKKNKNVNFLKLSDDLDFGPVRSVSSAKRINALGFLANLLFSFAKNFNPDYILWTESDLIFPQKDTINQLVEKMESDKTISAISPIIFAKLVMRPGGFVKSKDGKLLNSEKVFYDTWAYKNKNGSTWTNQPPYNIEYYLTKERYMEMDSVGSCCLVRASDVKDLNFDNEAFKGLCSQIISNGGKILLDKELEIYHPTNYYIENRFI